MTPLLTVIIPTHNPDTGRMRAALEGLRRQTCPSDRWETIVVDNASVRFPALGPGGEAVPPHFRIVKEPRLGLSAARAAGFAAARGEIAVLVDDDNVLAPDYLEQVAAIAAAEPRVGMMGGKSVPRFETPPPPWAEEFLPLLALRDLGERPLISQGLRPAGAAMNQYPPFAPIGAGMALRRAAWASWLANGAGAGALSDRRGAELSSGGDNDLVLCAMRAGWEVGYFPQLSLLHLIPSGRLVPEYLGRLNRGIQKSWMQVLSSHEANPWPPIGPAGAALRKTRAWFRHRAWSSPAGRIRWQGACGHFEGRVVR